MFEWAGNIFKRSTYVPEPSIDIEPLPEERSMSASTMDDAATFLKNLGLEHLIGNVSANNSMGIATFYGFVKYISNQISSLPYNVYRYDKTWTDRELTHPLSYALETRMNRNMSPFIGRRTMLVNAIVHGWSVSKVVRDEMRRTESIIPYACSEIYPIFDESSDNYFFHVNKTGEILSQDDVIFLKDLSFDGKEGTSITTFQNSCLRVNLQAMGFTTKFFENGTFMGGFITHPSVAGAKKEEIAMEIKGRVVASYKDGTGVSILPTGSEYIKIGLNPADSRLLEIFDKSDKDIAKMFNLPLTVIGDTEVQSSWGTGVEAMNTIVTNSVLMPWARQIEEEVDYKCFRKDEIQDGYFTEHNFKGLLRGDFKSQSEHIINSVNAGTMTPNEGRYFDNLRPLKKGGDDAYMNGTMTPISLIKDVKTGEQNGKGVSTSGTE